MIKKLWEHRCYVRFLLHSLIFNFHYLPFKQAIKLPVLLYKPKFLDLKGKVIIIGKVKPGMIKLGSFRVSFYPNSGIVWENHGGSCIFRGNCSIGNASTISIGENGNLDFGHNFSATAAVKIACYENITFANNVLIGWDTIVMDTDLHKVLDNTITQTVINKPKPIHIGEHVWIGCRCLILKGVSIANGNVIAANTVLANSISASNAIVGGNPPHILKQNIIWTDR